MSRAEHRRRERDRRRNRTVILGDGIVAAELGERFDATHVTYAQLPAKNRGRHRWVAAASFVLDLPDSLIADADTAKVLDARRLMYLGVGCWDCERAYQDAVGEPCSAPADVEPLPRE